MYLIFMIIHYSISVFKKKVWQNPPLFATISIRIKSNERLITKKPKSEQTKQNIIDTYLKLIPSKCWDKITVKELCAQANITRGTFYQY